MMQTVIQIVIVICLVVPIVGGFRDGAFAAIYSAARTFFGFLTAMTFYEPIVALILNAVPRLRIHPGPQYLRAIVFPTLFAVVFGLMRTLKVKFTLAKVPALPIVDKTVGPVVAFLHGVLIAGLLTFMWSLMPFAKYMPGDSGRVVEERLFWDAGSTALKFYSWMSRRMKGSRPFILNDEPIVKDVNGNGRVDPGSEDEWEDIIPNEKWDRGAITNYKRADEFTPEDIDSIFSEPDLE